MQGTYDDNWDNVILKLLFCFYSTSFYTSVLLMVIPSSARDVSVLDDI